MIRRLPGTNILALGYLKNETEGKKTWILLDCLVPVSAAVGKKRAARHAIVIGEDKGVIKQTKRQIPEISLGQTRIGDMVFKNERVIFKTSLTAEEIWQIESKESPEELFLDRVPVSAHQRILSFLAEKFPRSKTHYSLEGARDEILKAEEHDIPVKVVEIASE